MCAVLLKLSGSSTERGSSGKAEPVLSGPATGIQEDSVRGDSAGLECVYLGWRETA